MAEMMRMKSSNEIPAWADGRLTPVDKLEVHQRGLRHPAISVFIMDGTRTLIQRRALEKYHTPGLWANACCTHPHWGEAPEACATRRLHEELGITGLALTLRDRIEYRAEVGGGLIEHEDVDIFITDAPAGLSITANPAEVMATRWIELAALRDEIATDPARFTPWLRIYLAEHAGTIFARA